MFVVTHDFDYLFFMLKLDNLNYVVECFVDITQFLLILINKMLWLTVLNELGLNK